MADSSVFEPFEGPVWLSEVRCSGMESDLENCSTGPWAVNDCDQSDAAVICVLNDE